MVYYNHTKGGDHLLKNELIEESELVNEYEEWLIETGNER